MAGLSGGGWTTTLVGALDPRIDRLYPVSGSLPMHLRRTLKSDLGDWEQSEADGLYELVDYWISTSWGFWSRT